MHARPLKTVGRGVWELKISERAGQFRVIYVTKRSDRIYVLPRAVVRRGRAGSVTRTTGHKLNYVITALLAVARRSTRAASDRQIHWGAGAQLLPEAEFLTPLISSMRV